MEDVLWHSATSRLAKSILVKMPRLPTIRVIGSQFISTRLRFFLSTSDIVSGKVAMEVSFRFCDCPVQISGASCSFLISSRTIASSQLPPWTTPLRFFVHSRVGDTAHRADETAIRPNDVAGKLGPWWFVHKRH